MYQGMAKLLDLPKSKVFAMTKKIIANKICKLCSRFDAMSELC